MDIPWESWLSHYWVPNFDLMGFSWVFMVINRDKWNLPSGNIPNMVMCSYYIYRDTHKSMTRLLLTVIHHIITIH